MDAFDREYFNNISQYNDELFISFLKNNKNKILDTIYKYKYSCVAEPTLDKIIDGTIDVRNGKRLFRNLYLNMSIDKALDLANPQKKTYYWKFIILIIIMIILYYKVRFI